MPSQVTDCHTAWTCHLPSRGMTTAPSGYRITKTMAMPRPCAQMTCMLGCATCVTPPLLDPEPVVGVVAAALVNGLLSVAIVAFVMSKLKDVCASW